jgi:hypothetical protein
MEEKKKSEQLSPRRLFACPGVVSCSVGLRTAGSGRATLNYTTGIALLATVEIYVCVCVCLRQYTEAQIEVTKRSAEM